MDRFDVLVIEDFSRLSRRQAPMLTLLEELEDLGIVIHQVYRGVLDYDNVFMTGDEAAVAERYSRDTIIKGTNARYRKVLMGHIMSSGPKFGYNLVRFHDEKRSAFEINEAEAAVVKRIFREFLGGKSYTEIAKTIKIPKRSGAGWDDKGVRRVLEDETYTGRWKYGVQKVKTKREEKTRFYVSKDNYIEAQPGVIPDQETIEQARKSVVLVRVPRIIGDRTFTQAQNRIASVKRKHTQTPTKHVYILQGKVRCTKCGGSFWARDREKADLCSYRHRDGFEKYTKCPNKPISIRKEALERAVLDELVKLLQTPLEKIVEQYQDRTRTSHDRSAEINRTIEKLKQDMLDGAQKNIDGLFSDEIWRDFAAKAEAKIIELEGELKYHREVTEPRYLAWMPTEGEEAQHEKDLFEVEGRDYFSHKEWFELVSQLGVQIDVIGKDSGGIQIRLESDVGKSLLSSAQR
jgi:hypothetical protein